MYGTPIEDRKRPRQMAVLCLKPSNKSQTMAFVSFISYARINKTRYVEKFVRELTQQIIDKTPYGPNEIVFFDTTSINTGQDWSRVLGDALRTSKVIVCLCTPHYLNSEFCGKELQVFLL